MALRSLNERFLMTRPELPRTWKDWLCVFGPGAIMASLTIGTGELIFSSRGGALFGFHILFVFVLILLLKWGLVFATSRHMVLTGVHPYERMLDLPGPRGWVLILLLLIASVCLPIWISFHSGVIGNLISWMTGTGHLLNGGMDYVWAAAILSATLVLCAMGGYELLEKIQTIVVLAMVVCATLTLVLYQPDWIELLLGLVPQPLEYPDWAATRYPKIAQHSVWIETTRYVGVIGGAGFDYLAYTAWLREKSWGVLPNRATPEQLEAIANDPKHEIRQWINVPLVDCAISFAMVALFSAVFVASGAMFLRSQQMVPDEENLLNLQARFVTQIHPWLLPLYLVGAFLTMLGTLYGTIEIACSIADEISRAFDSHWDELKAHRLKRIVLCWCAPISLGIILMLAVRQATPAVNSPSASTVSATADRVKSSESPAAAPKPRLLLAILTPVNLFTGVLSCGLICLLTLWMDRRWLPRKLQPPLWLSGLNFISAIIFVGLGLKGYWEAENRMIALGSSLGMVVLAVVIARSRAVNQTIEPSTIPVAGEQTL
jgi:Mn2+/Fe2+ NRAMP family transporter